MILNGGNGRLDNLKYSFQYIFVLIPFGIIRKLGGFGEFRCCARESLLRLGKFLLNELKTTVEGRDFKLSL
jgi:hypothetical protein